MIASFALFLISSISYSALSLIRHNNFQSFAYDLGIYDQIIWLYSKFQAPFSTVKIPNMVILADHFTPSLALLSPIFWIKDDIRILLIAQALVFTSSLFPIYKIAKSKKLSELSVFAVCFSYLFFWGIQLALAFDFHEITIAAGILAWLFYFIHFKKWKLYFLFLIIFLGFKEDIPLIAASLGIFTILTYKNFRVGLTTIALSISYFFIVTKVLMTEKVLGQKFSHGVDFPNSLKNYFDVVFTPFIPKWKTIFLTLLPFSFLPLFIKGALFMITAHFFIHFLDPRFYGRWEIALHYRAPLTPILAVGAIFALSRLKTKTQNLFAVLIILFTVFTQFYLHAPLNMLSKKQFFQKQAWMTDIVYLINKIPPKASVATQNNILPHLSHRKQIYYFRIEDKHFTENPPPCGRLSCWWLNSFGAEYVLVDLHRGQPLNNYWDKNESQAKEAVESLISVGDYNIEEEKGEAILLKKIK